MRALLASGMLLCGVPLAAGGVRIEPDLGIVPANHLKFYLQFPGPMERGEVFRHLRLAEIDGAGRETGEVPEPFREVELWDETFTRLTLWFHPGRQKPGVNLNVEIGPILEEGKRYRLEISGSWRDEGGRPLGERVSHEFRAGPPDHSRPDPRRWTVEVGAKPVVRTDDLVDPISIRKSLTLKDERGNILPDAVASGIAIRAEKAPGIVTGLVFVRPDPLPPGRYRLVVDPRLEDLAGNSVSRPFNVDLASPGESATVAGDEATVDSLTIPFSVPEGRAP